MENSDIVLFVARIFWPDQCLSFQDLDRLEKSSLFSITPQFATWNIYEDMRIVARTAAVSINVTLYGPVAKTTIPILGE
ncbi:hypothetical protein F9C07_8374 [Aspergillus flavus]|uniref:Uncharacterized protein n=1 Tax=Aspergillus flavus (strain ATCC 200026 / FGSC A1120 / IAM 13836 / NRRL 3357 / JCM 12722 / SRRC 167) TaxID=332952 RepID=A0A7U2N1P3_ASPFN|nr:hypothetical protein F9C07_8374 [Aspergillus flavus]